MTTQTAGAVPDFTTADRLRKAREYAGLEQGQLAELMGVSRATVSNNETGKVSTRRIVVRAWAMATGVDLAWLETGTAPRPEPEGGELVRHQGLEPRTHWFGASGTSTDAVVLPFRERDEAPLPESIPA